jgi:hypothetical protein
MLNNVPLSLVPLPSLLICAYLQEICHLFGECLHNIAWLPYLQQLQAPSIGKTWMQEVLIGSCQEIKLYKDDTMLLMEIQLPCT